MNYEYDITGKLVNPIIIKCAQCGDEFESYYPTTKYCSAKCRNKSRYKDTEVTIKECLVCGKKFETKYVRAKYCSKYCANRRPRELNLTCQTCGKEFISPSNQTKYCSSKCRKKEVKTYKNICRNCGETFISEKYKKVYCSDECLTEGKRKVGQTSYKAKGNQYGGVEKREKAFKKKFEKRYTQFKYHSGFIDIDSDFNMECKVCGHIQTRNAQKVRPSRHKGLVCDNCFKLLQKRRCLINVLNKRINKIIREIEKDKRSREKEESRKIIKKCIECGKEFVTTKKKVVCCSKECTKKRANNHKDRRLRSCKNVDWSITLSKLIKRDKNVCHICGGKCDKKDYTINDDGHFIVGGGYPSIDHLVPISKGGQHVWENIKLAHCYCNTIKRDSEVYEGLNNQLVLAI